MVLDECVHYPCQRSYAEDSLKITTDWAKRSKESFVASACQVNKGQKLFAIVQNTPGRPMKILYLSEQTAD